MEPQGSMDNKTPTSDNTEVGTIVLNLLNFMLAIIISLVLVGSLIIYLNPQSMLNPFPPPTVVVFKPPSTPTPIPTLTNTPVPTTTDTPQPSATFTQLPTATLPPSPTPFTLSSPTPTLEPSEPPRGYPFQLQQGSPIAIANISHPDLGCNWMGVAGQVFDLNGAPVTGLLIQLGGRIPGVDIPRDMVSLTGAALNYGRVGYYEFALFDTPVASKNSVWVQLVNQEFVPLSPKIYFDTFDTCDKNLIIINFKQVR